MNKPVQIDSTPFLGKCLYLIVGGNLWGVIRNAFRDTRYDNRLIQTFQYLREGMSARSDFILALLGDAL